MPTTTSVAAPIAALLRQAIDYAGLFPPAGLDLSSAVTRYHEYRNGPDAWALGRFVVRAADLPRLGGVIGADCPLAVLLGSDLEPELDVVTRFGESHPGLVQAVELKGPISLLDRVPAAWPRYFEVPLDEDLQPMLEAIVAHGAFAKVRTGGIVPAAIPEPDGLAWFLVSCARQRLGFKATAGLHHPIRGSYRLTYQAGAPSGIMFGYLNLALAAAVAWSTGDIRETEAALIETRPGAIHWNGEGLGWRNHEFSTGMIEELRRECFHGFGSCSFREPLDELSGLGLAR